MSHSLLVRRLHAAAWMAVVAVVGAACAPGRVELDPTPTAYAPVVPTSVQVYAYVSPADLPPSTVRLATARARHARPSSDDRTALADHLRQRAAGRGANAIVALDDGQGFTWVAVRLDSATTLRWADSLNTARYAAQQRALSGGVTTGGGSVQVRGYCRKDGVCVRPHTRSRPGTKSRGSSRRRRP